MTGKADYEVEIHPVGKDGQPWSGTACYGLGCRCSSCRASWAAYSKLYKANKRAQVLAEAMQSREGA